eukprot:m.743812 g.743812  ORF g.743812 m.743812 type:complete len:51 (+) comp58947_c0_seq21:1-153(+)
MGIANTIATIPGSACRCAICPFDWLLIISRFITGIVGPQVAGVIVSWFVF